MLSYISLKVYTNFGTLPRRVKMCLLCDGFFSFAVALQITYSFYFELLLCYLMSAIGMNRQECKHK